MTGEQALVAKTLSVLMALPGAPGRSQQLPVPLAVSRAASSPTRP
jgi:hypothetical protein